jgi:DNA-binding protein YbaB|tara:strand:+ start:825 stop:1025 length:201 start_codon:yes stop_codon:yes gene_type:complete
MADAKITMKHLAEKLDHMHSDIEKNSADIHNLQLEMSYGRGAVKAVAWIGGCIAVVVGLMRIFNGG